MHNLPFLPLVKNFLILSKGVEVLALSLRRFCILSYSSLIAASCLCLSLKLCLTSFRPFQFCTNCSTSAMLKTLFLKSVMISISSSWGLSRFVVDDLLLDWLERLDLLSSFLQNADDSALVGVHSALDLVTRQLLLSSDVNVVGVDVVESFVVRRPVWVRQKIS